MHMCKHIHTHACTHTHTHTHTHTRACTHTHARTHTRMHTHAHAHAHTHTHTHAHTHTHTHSHQGDTYFTVHVTPQTECSWVSFETNLEKESYSTLISKVLSLFRPGKCVVSLFASKVSKHTQVEYPLLMVYVQ